MIFNLILGKWRR